MSVTAVIYGCEGPVLSAAEEQFFRRADPLGFILFARNCIDPAQVKALAGALRACVGRADAPILIDQEGGRVQRLKPPHWRAAPPPRAIGDLFRRDPSAGREAARLNAALIAAELRALDIDVDCVPCLDVPVPGAHDVIGDRAYALDAAVVAELGRVVADTMISSGILPVIKHMPGHGRAGADSHFELPMVATSALELQRSDFLPFKALAAMPLGMTAHVLYRAIDAQRAGTLSPRVIGQIVRGWIGFDGLLMCDDLSMKALGGTLGERLTQALQAGCDVVLHCNGQMAEMAEVAAAAPALSPAGQARWARARRLIARPNPPPSAQRLAAAKQRLDALLGASS